jgi:hypothetical protein
VPKWFTAKTKPFYAGLRPNNSNEGSILKNQALQMAF